MTKAVLFDMDGLLVDTESLGIRAAVEVCSRIGIALDTYERHSFIGITDEEFYQKLLRKRGGAYDGAAMLKKHYQIYEKLLQTKLCEFPNAIAVVKKIHAHGYRIGIVSGSTSKQIQIVLKQLRLERYVDVVVSCDDTKKSKPDPEGFLQAATISEVAPHECMVFEDSTVGVLAAKKAGMFTIGVINAGGQDLSAADVVIQNLTNADFL